MLMNDHVLSRKGRIQNICDLPMNQHTSTSVTVQGLNALVGVPFPLSIRCAPVAQTLLNESIAPGEPHKKVLVFNVVDWNVKMLESAREWIVFVELPVQYGHDVGDATILQSLRPPQGYEASERISWMKFQILKQYVSSAFGVAEGGSACLQSRYY